MDGDLILQWLSSRGRGSMSDVTASVATLVDGLPYTRMQAARAYLRRLEVLGHLDLLWSDSKWQIRPTVLTQLPGSSAFAVAIGRRTPELEEQLEAEAVLHRVQSAKTETFSFGDPSILLLEYDNEAELNAIATQVGARFLPCAALSIARNLPLLGPGPRSAGPNTYGSPIQMFNVFNKGFTEVETIHRNGLYRQKINGRSQYWLFKSGTWSSSSHAEGVCLVLSETNARDLNLKILEDGEDPVGSLRVDVCLPLPLQHRQALTLCSGVNPAKSPGEAWTYDNVPSSVALAVARSIHQHLHVS